MPELIMIENGKAKILGEFKAYWTFFFFLKKEQRGSEVFLAREKVR